MPTTGNINDKEVSKFNANSEILANNMVGTTTKPTGTVSDLSNRSLVDNS